VLRDRIIINQLHGNISTMLAQLEYATPVSSNKKVHHWPHS